VTKPAITLLFIAKQPVPGRVKPRLVPPRAHPAAGLRVADLPVRALKGTA
jgi:glycosyltransferase A (GT-A) superfamily protein (DUF2064 family)